MSLSSLSEYSDAVVFRVAQLFVQDQLSPAKRIAEQVNDEFRPARPLTRETIYPLLGAAIERNFIRLVPPANRVLAEKLARQFPNVIAERTLVVETAGRRDTDKVAAAAAQLAFDLLPEIKIAYPSRPIGLGLGPGRATLDFCRHFSRLLEANPQAPELILTAISAGGPPYSPEYASTSFFNLFPRHLFASNTFPPDATPRQVGLFAESLVPARDLPQIKRRSGVKEAFEMRDSVDLIITAMGDMKDEHDLLGWFLHQSGVDLSELRAAGWVGNVQYRPYSATGPIKEKPSQLRAVTLFELEDLAALAKQDCKHVILIARQCGICGRTRAEALRPLLTRPEMKVFSRLVVDAVTTVELLRGEGVEESGS